MILEIAQSAPTQAPTRYAEVAGTYGTSREVGPGGCRGSENKAQTSLRDAGPSGSARASESTLIMTNMNRISIKKYKL
jgi:hypothetical protein